MVLLVPALLLNCWWVAFAAQLQSSRIIRSEPVYDHGTNKDENISATSGQECDLPEPVTEFGDLQWALQIDGMSASDGCSAYGKEFNPAFQALDTMLRDFGRGVIDLKMVEKLAAIGGIYEYRLPPEHPLTNYGPVCFYGMSCEAKKQVLEGIPKELYHFPASYQRRGCKVDVPLPRKVKDMVKDVGSPKVVLEGLIKDYNTEMQNASSSESKLFILASFLRSFSWLHPFTDHNGRTRTLLLQREIRRTGLGRGTVMFNNNRDVFFISTGTYVEKIKEGIRMADAMFAKRRNPWLNKTNVEKHFQMFPPPSQSCTPRDANFGQAFSSKEHPSRALPIED